jgi:hypothetical protein
MINVRGLSVSHGTEVYFLCACEAVEWFIGVSKVQLFEPARV